MNKLVQMDFLDRTFPFKIIASIRPNLRVIALSWLVEHFPGLSFVAKKVIGFSSPSSTICSLVKWREVQVL